MLKPSNPGISARFERKQWDRSLLGKLVKKASTVSLDLRARMETFSSDFTNLVDLRSKLFHAHPYTAKGKEQRLKYWERFDWTLDEIDKAAKAFELASVEAGELRLALQQPHEQR